jgi:hypothetical protein
MGIIIAVMGIIVITAAAVWMTPLRSVLLQCVKNLDRYKFTCKIDQLIDESQPVNQDQFFSVQMVGRIPTPEDDYDTDVRIEISDITRSLFDPEKILSADEHFRSSDDVGFQYVTHNGTVPQKNAVLSHWVTVGQIPCHVLRFAYRGRRKLLFKVSVLSKQTGDCLVSSQRAIEYVYCGDGFREIQDRRMDVLRSSVELAALSAVGSEDGSEECLTEAAKAVLTEWIDQKAQNFAPATELKQTIESLPEQLATLSVKQSADSLLACGEQADKMCAIELVLQSMSANSTITSVQLAQLSEIAEIFGIKQDRLLAIAQKRLLSADCTIENPAFLLGISGRMDEESFRKTLNEEYRKWNARVTHPDVDIRRQADKILSLIADLRSQRTCRC